jgi:hypothetical protein
MWQRKLLARKAKEKGGDQHPNFSIKGTSPVTKLPSNRPLLLRFHHLPIALRHLKHVAL